MKPVKKGRSRRPAAPKEPSSNPTALKQEGPDIFIQHFWKTVAAIFVLFLIIRIFDFNILPLKGNGKHERSALSFHGNMITRPFYGLHSWAQASGAWACRSHVKYGLDYTKGYSVLVVGDPPPENPYRYSNHPQYTKLISALGMWIFGTNDWSLRVYGLILAAPMFFLLVYLLKKIFPPQVVLMSSLILILFPLTGYFGYGSWLAIVGLWGLWRYMQITGQLPLKEKDFRWRWIVEYAVASFIMVQLGWAGTFYAATFGLHYIVFCLLRQLNWRWVTFAALAVPSLLSLTLNFVVMAKGFESNLEKEQARTEQVQPDDAVEAASQSPIDKIIALYKWRSKEAERGSFSWEAWSKKTWDYAVSNFSLPALVICFLSVLYQGVVHALAGYARLIKKNAFQAGQFLESLPYRFVSGWYFILPGVLFLLLLRGLVWEHQYYQQPFALFVAIGTSLGILTAGRWLSKANGMLGKIVVVGLLILVGLYCNRGLADYREDRWQSPRTIELFQKLHDQIPPDKDLLTFKDYLIQQSETKIPYYRPEYAWYLDREMIQANAWPDDPKKVAEWPLQKIVSETIAVIREKAGTGNYPFYLLPVQAAFMAEIDSPLYTFSAQSPSAYQQLTSLSDQQLQQMLLRDQQKPNFTLLVMEKYRRYRRLLAEDLAKICAYEYFANPARPNEENYCVRGNTPCYIFDLSTLKTENSR